MHIKRIVLRAAADFAGTNTQTPAIDIRGARMAVFELTATNAQVLSVGQPQACNDAGATLTNWISLSGSASAKANAVAESGAATAMNAGPVMVVVAPSSASSLGPIYLSDRKLRLNYTAAAQVTGLGIVAYVYYDSPVLPSDGNESVGMIS